MIDIEVKPIHNEIAKHIKKETGKGVRAESVALVLDGARDYRAGEKERAAIRREEKKQAKIADLQAKLAALTGEAEEAEAEPAPAPKRGAAKKAATPAPKKKKAEPEPEPEVEKPKAKAKKKAEPEEIDAVPDGALPIEVTVEEDAFETPDEDEEDEWDIEPEDDDEDAEDF